jgi:hypothetical protein
MHVEVKNAFNSIFQTIIFRELCDARGPLVSIVPFTKLFMVFIFLFSISMGDMWKGSPFLSFLQAQGRVTS